MSINWIEAYYWASRLQNPASTPGHAAPLVSEGYTNSDQNISAPMPQTALEEIQLPLPGFYFGRNNGQPAQNSDAITTCVTTSEPQEPAN